MKGLIVVWFWPALVFAQPASPATDQPLPDVESPCAPQLAANRSAVVQNAGEAGVWFHRTLADCMLGRLQLLPMFASRIRLLEERLQVSDQRHDLQVREVDLAQQAEHTAEQALEAAMRRASVAEAERDAWYRAPLLWFTVGVVVAVALELVAVALLKAI